MAENGEAKVQRLAAVAEAFTPGAPIDHQALFAGRLPQIIDVMNAVSQKGQHVVLFGERGVGKTSLANVIAEIAGTRQAAAPIRSVRTNCGSADDFTTLWLRLLGMLELAEDLPDQGSFGWQLGPEDVRQKLEHLQGRALIVIDELDRLEDNAAISLLADTIKTLSDYAVAATVMLVGVADSIDDLIGDHRSIERALVQVQMPRMDAGELTEIIDKGLTGVEMTIEPTAKDRIARLSEGLPHYTHSLGLHAAQWAVSDDRSHINDPDVDVAIEKAVEKAQHSIRRAYENAIQSARRDALYAEVLLACALAPKNRLGYFLASGVRHPMSRLMGKPYEIPAFARHLKEFSSSDRGAPLQKTGKPRRVLYRFENPLLQPFVILEGISTDRVSEELVRELQREAAKASSAPTVRTSRTSQGSC